MLHFHFHPGCTVRSAAQTDGTGLHSGHLRVLHGDVLGVVLAPCLVLLQERLPLLPGVLTPADNTSWVGLVNPPDGLEEAILAGEVALVEPSACVHRIAAEISESVAIRAPQKRSGHPLLNKTEMDSGELTA